MPPTTAPKKTNPPAPAKAPVRNLIYFTIKLFTKLSMQLISINRGSPEFK